MKGFIIRFIFVIFILLGIFLAPKKTFAQTCTCGFDAARGMCNVTSACPGGYVSLCSGAPACGSCGCQVENPGVNCVTSGAPTGTQTCCTGYHLVAGVCTGNPTPTTSTSVPGGSTTEITTPDICCDAACTRVSTAIGCIPANITDITSTLLSFGVGIAGGIAFLLILLGGFQILTSSGNPEQLEAGKELVSSAITGLILIIFSVFILKFLGVNVLGIPTLQ